MKKGYSLLFSFLLFPAFFYAQSIANYTTSRTTAISYNSIAGTGTAIDSWRNNGGFSQDDNRSIATDIGFDFWYNGVRYTQFSVSTNGFVDFSSSTADGGPLAGPYGYDNAQFTGNGSGTRLAIAPFYDDMTAQGGVDALGNSIKYLVTGTAPTRVLTIEWINMAVYLNTTPSLNFQVKLYETTGVIEFLYGTMTQGTANFSYTCGINAATLANTPTAAQLKCQQTANSNTFNNTEQNGLTVMPTNNSKITFTPTVTTPASPSGTLTFTGITQTGMTVNWTNWCTNEVGYVVYNSIDNINFNFVAQTAVNATNSVVTGLMPGTTYYWKLYAVTDGFLSTSINGTQATNAAGNKFSTGNGNWNVAGTWTPAGVPTASDNVTIRNGHTVSINVNATCYNLTVGEGVSGVLRYTGGTNLTMNVNGNLLVNTGASFNIANNATHTLNLNGNLINNGLVDFRFNANRVCNVNFIKNGNATLGGTGGTNQYNLINVNMGTSINNTLDVTATNFAVQTNFLTLTNGTFKLSTVNTLTLTPFTALATINNTSGFTVNSSTATVNFPVGVSLYGNLIVHSGIVNIGDAANENIISNGGVFQIFGGTVNVAGQYYSSNINTLSKFTISGGILTVPSVGCTSTTIAPFQIDGAGSTFNMSGGTIIIPREGGTGAQDLGYTVLNVSNSAVTGGTLQIGSASTPLTQTININSSARIGNLLVNSANATARLNLNSLTVTNNVTITAGTLNANNLNITLGANWLNSGTFTPGTGTVTFNGGNQTITKIVGEVFNNLVLAGNNTKSLGGSITTSNLTINSGSTFDISTNNYAVNVRGNYLNNGTFNTRTGTVTFNGTTLQSIGGSSVTSFNNIVLNNTAGAGLTSAQNLVNTLTLTNGTFATNNQGFTLISNANGTARIATIPATGNITGNITMQRYIPSGTDGWMFLCTPVSGATLQQWDDDFITGGFPGSAYPYPIVTNASIVSYDETLSGIYDDGFVEPTNITNPITPNKGYWAYIMNTPVTIDVTGPALKNTINFGVTYTDDPAQPASEDGWNLVANPYPSTIDWNAAGWTKTNVANAVYMYSPTLDQYTSYVAGIGTNGGSNLIASSQAFLVQTTGPSPLLQITEVTKNATDGIFIRTPSSTIADDLLKLNLTGLGYYDETVIRFNSDATPSFDLDYDALKFYSFNTDVPAIATMLDTNKMSINTLPLLTNNVSIPLKVKVGISGMYTIHLDSLTNMPSSACIILTDLLTGIQTDLRINPNYTFSILDTTEYARFVINIGAPIQTTIVEPTCSGMTNGSATAQGIGAGPWSYTWLNESGAVIQTHTNVTGADALLNIAAGEYTVVVGGNTGLCNGTMTEVITVTEPSLFSVLTSTTNATCSGTADGSISIDSIVLGNAPFTYLWSNGVTIANNQNLNSGNYSLLITDNLGCSQTLSYFVNQDQSLSALFTMSDDTVYVGLNNTVVFSNYSSGANSFIWDFGDGSALDYTVNPVHNYTMAGVYQVILVVSDGICNDTLIQTIVVNTVTNIHNSNNSIENVALASNSNDVYELIFNLNQSIVVTVEVYNSIGQKTEITIVSVIQNGRIPLSFEDKAAGVYYIKINLGEEIMTKKIVKK